MAAPSCAEDTIERITGERFRHEVKHNRFDQGAMYWREIKAALLERGYEVEKIYSKHRRGHQPALTVQAFCREFASDDGVYILDLPRHVMYFDSWTGLADTAHRYESKKWIGNVYQVKELDGPKLSASKRADPENEYQEVVE